jgi:hypothetical protein
MTKYITIQLNEEDLIRPIVFPNEMEKVYDIVKTLKPSDFKIDIRLIYEADTVSFAVGNRGYGYFLKSRDGKIKSIWSNHQSEVIHE